MRTDLNCRAENWISVTCIVLSMVKRWENSGDSTELCQITSYRFFWGWENIQNWPPPGYVNCQYVGSSCFRIGRLKEWEFHLRYKLSFWQLRLEASKKRVVVGRNFRSLNVEGLQVTY